jgi:hypothetical protein
MSNLKLKDPKSTVSFKDVQLKRKLTVAAGVHNEQPVFGTWDCSGATGTVTSPTTVLVACYLKNRSTGTNYYANTINNNDPQTGDWNASNFPTGMPSGTYDMWIEGDDESTNSVGPLDCN